MRTEKRMRRQESFHGAGAFLSSVVCLAVCFSAQRVAAFTLAERGKAPECSIVLPQAPTEAQQYAADELQNFTQKMTGTKLPIEIGTGLIVTNKGEKEKLKVARTVALVAPTNSSALAPDAFRLRVDKNRLTIEGGSDRGLLYGVYELLEKYGGCRWYTSWCDKIPSLSAFSVPDTLNDTQTPAFAMREPYWYDIKTNPDFACRNRANGPSMRLAAKHGGTPYRFGGGLGSCHTFNRLCPPAKYFAEHPEYFSEINGHRFGANGARTQLCLTNPDVLRIVTSNVLECIRKDPGAAFYGVSQNDWGNFCTCPACKAIDDYEESHAGTVIAFVNKIAEAVEKEFPNVIIETLAYQYTRTPPKHIKPRANVMPCLCTIECDYSHAIPKSSYKQNVKFMDDIKGWGQICKQIYVWDYVTDFSHYTMPYPNILSLQDNVRFFRDNRVSYLFEQGASQGRHADFAELKAWLLAHWMWNPELPQEKLLDDFFTGYYGAGAPYVRIYFDALHSFFRDPASHPMGCYTDVRTSVFPDDFFDRARALWKQAEEAVKNGPEVYRYNVRMGEFSVIYAQLMRSPGGNGIVAWVAEHPETYLAAIQARKDLAKGLLDRMAESKTIRIAEQLDASIERVESWRKILSDTLPGDLKGIKGVVIEDSALALSKPGVRGARVKDPLAEDGSALKLFNSHFEWCVSLGMSRIAYDAGAKYKLSARIRVDKKPGMKGMAFWTGVYDEAKRRNCGEIQPKTENVKDGYIWYDILTWKPEGSQYFWAGPGVFGRNGYGDVSHNGVYIDAIRIERCE